MAEQRHPGSGSTAPGGTIQRRDTPQEGSARVSDTARHVTETTAAYYEQGREQLDHAEQYLEEHIRAKPLQAVVLAAGIGLLVGLLWKH